MRKNFLLVSALALVLVGCTATGGGQQRYAASSVGQVNRTVSATVISVREVEIDGTSGTGGSVGGGLGAVAGSSLGSNSRDGMAGAIVGAVAGAMVGAAIEEGSTKKKGREYVVQTANGNLFTLVQEADPPFKTGDKVLVLHGVKARIVQDPRSN
jgi:outer membrane lipoprotein SlyB